MSTPTLDPALAANDVVLAQYRAQARYAALAALTVYEAWASLDLLDIPGSVGGWLDVLTPQLINLRDRSATSAATYLDRLRAAQGVGGGFDATPVLTTAASREAIRSALAATGPASAQRALARAAEAARPGSTKFREPVITTSGSATRPTAAKAGATPSAPARVGRANPNLPPSKLAVIQAASAKAAIAHVTNGGRDTVDNLIRRDRAVVGYVRVTSGKPCYFCAMLASRGPVYQQESFRESDPRFFGPGNVKVHDNCNCMLRPLYSQGNENFIEQHRTYDRLWRSVSHKGNGRRQINAFRKAYKDFLTTGEIPDGELI